jgi:hypothetical protein
MKLKPGQQYKVNVKNGDFHVCAITVGIYFNYITEGTTYSDFDVTASYFPPLKGDINSFETQIRAYNRASCVIPNEITEYNKWIEEKLRSAYGIDSKIKIEQSI